MQDVIQFIAELPAWIWAHRWTITWISVLATAFLASAILVNPEGRQLREKLRRRR